MKIRQIFVLLLILTVSLILSACSSPTVNKTDGKPGTRVVTDVWGRKVEIPTNVKSIICLGSGVPRMAAYLGVVDMMVGSEDHDAKNLTVLRDYNPVYQDKLKNLPLVGKGGGSGSNNGYPEKIITVNPDVIIAGFSPEAAEELSRQTKIPVVCVRYISNNFVDETFYTAMRVFAEVVGAQERCEKVLSFIDACKKDLNARTESVAESKKIKAYTGAVTFNGRHGFAGTYSNFGPFLAINALNVADEVKQPGYFEADLEKVIVWDPDVIFLDPGNMDLVRDEYSTNANYFDNLRAFREGRVYTMPSFNNCGTNITYAIMDAYYAGTILFPEQFGDVDIAQKSSEILTFFLGKDIYGIMENNGLYYGKIKLGD